MSDRNGTTIHLFKQLSFINIDDLIQVVSSFSLKFSTYTKGNLTSLLFCGSVLCNSGSTCTGRGVSLKERQNGDPADTHHLDVTDANDLSIPVG